MMALWAICTAAQPQMPRVLEDGFRLMPNPHQFTVKPMKAADKAEKGIAAKATKSTKRTKARADEATYQVNFVLDFDTENQKAYQIRLLSKDYETGNFDQEIWQLEKGTTTLTVPGGTYDIIVEFWQLDPLLEFEWELYSMYVIREQVTIDQDMELNFSADEAKNHIHFQTLTIDGEPARPGRYAVDDEWNWTLLEEGNVEDVLYQTRLFCKDYGTLNDISGNFGAIAEGEVWHNAGDGAHGDFRVNDVSDRWAFYSFRTALNGRNIYTSAYETIGASGDVTVSNDPSKFQLFEDPFITTSHPGEDVFMGFNYGPRNPMDWSWGSTSVHFVAPLSEGEPYKFYLSASAEDSQVGYVPYITPDASIYTTVVYNYGEETWENEEYVALLQSLPLTVGNGQAIFANNGSDIYGYEYSEEVDEMGRDVTTQPFWPTHPVFSYPVEKKKENLGNSCPMLLCNPLQYEMTYNWEDEDGNPVSQTYRNWEFSFCYQGRYGETKDDSGLADVKIKVDGEEAITANGAFYAQLEQLITGVIDATIDKEGIVVDEMEGSNKAQLHYTAGAEDQNPPTVTMLGFRAENGDITDRFATAAEGTLEFSAGDFNFSLTPNNYAAFDRYAPESVEVSYSPYGEDNWNELAMEEVSENYWPTMGWFYTGSLASVTGEGLNGWFDLKIRLTDAAGNWQEQVISPAFRIDDLAYSSVVTITPDKVGDNAIYNLAGQRMRGGLESLPHGIYIVGGKKVVK